MNIADLEKRQLQNRLDMLRAMRQVEVAVYGALATALAAIAILVAGTLQ